MSTELREGLSIVGRRTRVAAATLVFVLGATVLVGGIRTFLGHRAPLTIPVGLCALVLLIVLRRTGNMSIVGNGIGAMLALALVGVAYLAGGIGAPALYALALVPIFMLFLAGARSGLVWTVLCLAAVGGFKLIEVSALPWVAAPEPGRSLPAAGAALLILGGGAVGWVYESAREASDVAVRASEERARALLRAFPDAFVQLDARGVCIRAHEGRATGIFGDDPVGRGVSSLLPEAPSLVAELDEAHRTEAEVERELFGEQRALLVRIVPLTDKGALLIVRDVSARRQMETRLVEAELLATLERADRMSSIGLLAAGMAHEINNPLAYLAGNLEFLAREEMSPNASEIEERRSAIGDAKVAAERIRRIVQDLKLYARDEESAVERVHPKAIVDSALKLAHNEIQHRATLEVSHEDAPPMAGVESRLVQVVLNLLLNAAQALPPGMAGQHRISVRTFKGPKGRAVIEVSDTGPGIPQELLPRLTEPFFTTKPAGVGTGLGLAVCDGIVRRLGGELQIRNREEGGATVSVSLPAATNSAPSAAAPAPAPNVRVATARGRILVVDDEPLVRRALRRLLRSHQVVEASSGAAALEILGRGDRFDVILCDVMMPELTGLDVYREVHAQWPGLEDRMIFMTGGAFDHRVQELFAALVGEQLVLDKPFDTDELQRVVAERIAAP